MATTPRNELMKINSLPSRLFNKAFNKPLSKESKEKILSTKQSCVGFWSEVDMFSLELDGSSILSPLYAWNMIIVALNKTSNRT